MTKPVKIVAAVILAAFAVQFTWFEISNKLQVDKDIQSVKEQTRPLTMAEMDGYLKKGEDAKRQEVSLHRGEVSPGGLRIGMSRAEALAAFPGGTKDRAYPDIMRFPLPSKSKQEVIARFIDDSLCFSTIAAAGTDAFGIDLVKRHGEPDEHGSRTR